MKRRNFVKNTLAVSALGATASSVFAEEKNTGKHKFNLNYAPHFGMFRNSAGNDIFAELQFMADQGFTALEDNGLLGRTVEVQERLGKELQRLGMTMGVFVVDGGDNWKISLTSGKKEFIDNFVKTCKISVEAAKRVNAKWMTVVPGFYDRNLPIGIQTANVIEALRRGAEIFEPHGLIMVLEPLSDTPELFLRNSDQTYMICKAVNSPSCKILYDAYHMQRNEGQIIKNIELCWDEIAYFQIGDNPGRKEPTSGEMNYKNIFKYIYDRGYKGVLGMEHGNAKPGKEGEEALIRAYKEVDNFK
ncbi:hydroxypyruvate isomerase family protein [Thermoflexibacter ruber]|uniref:Hydroxypyruvate isomerase n=1 Tax=Thermoflexibacter ruber TaxID=1003 RepID=A0A1I2HES7_9BACT|nr:TIM barrel protein [Thermoflexibacter ruber]SFF28172.1 hydroxypyruvate isomerase [Thermoflexibacter ruber]